MLETWKLTFCKDNVVLLNECVEGILLQLCDVGCRCDRGSCQQAKGHVSKRRHVENLLPEAQSVSDGPNVVADGN